jgi:hypothetical protein
MPLPGPFSGRGLGSRTINLRQTGVRSERSGGLHRERLDLLGRDPSGELLVFLSKPLFERRPRIVELAE